MNNKQTESGSKCSQEDKEKSLFNYTMQSLHHFVLVGDDAGVDCDDLK